MEVRAVDFCVEYYVPRAHLELVIVPQVARRTKKRLYDLLLIERIIALRVTAPDVGVLTQIGQDEELGVPRCME
jgi:hypothetical protein